jgi:hypothetical protein
MRLQVATDLVKYCNNAIRNMLSGNHQWIQMVRNFEIQQKDFNSVQPEDATEILKVINTLPFIK